MPFDIYVPRYVTRQAGVVLAPAAICGHYDVAVVTKAGWECPRRRASFPNVITNQGLEHLFSQPPTEVGMSPWRVAFAGVGNTPEDVTDVQMDSVALYTGFAGSLGNTVTNLGPPDYVIRGTISRTTEPAESPLNITEVGIGGVLAQTSPATPWESRHFVDSRALIRDGDGNPITIGLLTGERLRISYSKESHVSMADNQYTINISGSSYDVTTRVYKADVEGGHIGWETIGGWNRSASAPTQDLLALNTGVSTSESIVNVNSAYVPNSHTLEFSRLYTPDQANYAGGIGRIIGARSSYTGISLPTMQFSFDPKIPKTDQYRLEMFYKFVVGRHTP